MKWEVVAKPAYSMLKVYLSPGDEVTAEAGAFVAGQGDYEIVTETGGVLKAFARALLGGETIFLNRYRARGSCTLWFAPSLPGDIEYVKLNGRLIVQDMSYIASHGNVDISVAWRGFKGLLAEGELVWLKLDGFGGVWVNSYGGIEKIDLKPGEKLVLDNFHFVAMDDTIRYRITKFGGIKSFILGGEGIVAELEGPGRILIQSRSLPPFAQLLAKLIGRR
jgi:uncharacterized protein (TIGR00266 family)